MSYQGWDARSLYRRTSVKHNSVARQDCEREKAELGCRASHFRNSQFRNTLAFRNSAERKPRGKQHGESEASGKRPSEAAARPIFVTANFETRLLFVVSWGPQGIEARIIDAHPRRFADPQDDSIFHPRTWHRAAGCARTRAAFKSSDTPSQSFARKRSCRRKPAEAFHEDHRVCELADCRL